MLGVLLCYNDGDLLEESIRCLLGQNHHLVIWDHGSTDETAEVIDKMRGELIETRRIPRSFDFYQLHAAMSDHLIANYVRDYDWISWPDQDEFLEGPSRDRPYAEYVRLVHNSPFDWIQFNNMNYWCTTADDINEPSILARVCHYSLFPDCAPRIRSWRASSTNRREFNHNPPLGRQYPVLFNLRHYPMRSEAQIKRRVHHDRLGLRRGNQNYHYESMQQATKLILKPEQLHFDDGVSELSREPKFNWREIYGYAPNLASDSVDG
jgi:glycosyltransferase involved in cell wall biosynthesis